ncbi:hypothetical protein E2C01_019159 [Portunus trituberculatus]|uniref:Uncharacterized protein n=1 Tax=Portunus trituberculatus TaxID=210409 RepID=A0A5B7DWW0_PORTR|nr:hypothetical protein [Portunus trituberculatus]
MTVIDPAASSTLLARSSWYSWQVVPPCWAWGRGWAHNPGGPAQTQRHPGQNPEGMARPCPQLQQLGVMYRAAQWHRPHSQAWTICSPEYMKDTPNHDLWMWMEALSEIHLAGHLKSFYLSIIIIFIIIFIISLFLLLLLFHFIILISITTINHLPEIPIQVPQDKGRWGSPQRSLCDVQETRYSKVCKFMSQFCRFSVISSGDGSLQLFEELTDGRGERLTLPESAIAGLGGDSIRSCFETPLSTSTDSEEH